MNEEQWNELLELRKKISLTPKTDYRYSRLEDFFFYHHCLSTYSQEELKRLFTTFGELPDQEKQDLISRATKRTHPNFFHLSDAEVDKFMSARPELSFHERARLSDGFISTKAGTAWFDLGEVSEAVIEIDDNSSPARAKRPHAQIYFSHGSQRRVETVDIIESVKNNATAIGHPAIVFAIYHWQRVINAKRVVGRDDVTTSGEWGKITKEVIGDMETVRVAEKNLAAIGKALETGAKKRAIPNAFAFALNVKLMGLDIEDQNTVVYQAWEQLKAISINRTDEVEQEERSRTSGEGHHGRCLSPSSRLGWQERHAL